MKRPHPRWIGILASILLISTLSAAKPPNIVLILADDFGVGDIQAHYPNNKIPTPHLDRLVRQGISFTDAHSPSAVCSPTRYAILTGRYAWRTPLQEWVIAAYEPPLIQEGRLTLPSFLRNHGYHTACIGKWHLGWDWPGPQESQRMETPNGQKLFEWDFTKPIMGGPIERGFDEFFGVDLPNLPPFTFIEQDRILIQPTERYVHDPTAGVVMPRGMVGCPIAPDWKFDAILPEITERAVQRIHKLATQEQPFFLFFTMTSPHEPIVPSAAFKGKSGMAPIADFVMETDWSAGQLIEAVDQAGIADDTLIIFTADNGHSHYTGWQALVDAGHQPSGPFRGHKGDIWEGGHRVPLVVRWPHRFPANASSDQLVSLTDFFATFAEILQAPLPTDAAEDSASFLASALGNAHSPHRSPIVSHSNHGEFAYRNGPWKLVFRNRSPNKNQCRGEPRIVELYNLEEDPAETNNLAPQRPDRVNQLTAAFDTLVQSGASRSTADSANDAPIDYTITQVKRWADTPPRNTDRN